MSIVEFGGTVSVAGDRFGNDIIHADRHGGGDPGVAVARSSGGRSRPGARRF
jgi:hypothetical protein